MPKPTILLRAEYKPNEHRTPLTPSHLASLSSKYQFLVETSSERIFDDAEYENAGATIVPQGTWLHFQEKYDKGNTGYVLGLKELPEASEIVQCEMLDESKTPVETPFAVSHRHIMFAHCYKYQNDWRNTMQRFKEGNAELLDLEFLQWDNGRRVAAFGRAAGFAGMAVGLLGYVAQQQQLKTNPSAQKVDLQLDWYRNNADLVNLVKKQLSALDAPLPTVLVLGALGRCGGGAVQFAQEAGLPAENIIQWDLEETKVGGPFLELLKKPHVLVNCIYVNGKIPPFIDQQLLSEVDSKGERRMTVFVDVSCEMSQNNPFPINTKVTTFPDPLRRLVQPSEGVPPLDCCAIDHLPAMIPRQSSEDFSQDLLETLSRLGDVNVTRDLDALEKLAEEKGSNEDEDKEKAFLRVWYRAKALYQRKLREFESS